MSSAVNQGGLNANYDSDIYNESTKDREEVDIDFVTLGMFIIDEIHYQPPKAPVTGVLGGAGAYAALGARIVSPCRQSKSVGWIVDAGNDFPDELRKELASWETSCLMRETSWRYTTRGANYYGANEERAFQYLTPKLRLDEESLDDRLLRSKAFHLICSSSRCIDMITKIESKRKQIGLEAPLWVWEPVPDLCTPEELDSCRSALRLVDIVSPNHIELCNFFGKSAVNESGDADQDLILELCRNWYESGIGRHGTGSVVVRAGKDGCFVVNSKQGWMPSYHKDPSKVIDPTGGGNAFLGAMATVFARSTGSSKTEFERIWEAACAGSVGASYAIEQVGVPKLELSTTCEEMWNGEAPSKRFEYFASMEAAPSIGL